MYAFSSFEKKIRLKFPTSQTALLLLRSGFDKIPISPTDMRGLSLSLEKLFFLLIRNPAALHDALTVPASWSVFANVHAYNLLILIFQAAQSLNIPCGGNYHIPSGTVPDGDEPGDSAAPTLISHAFEAIVGADNFIDVETHITMKDVLSEIVEVTQTVSVTCEWHRLPCRNTTDFGALRSVGAIWGLG